MVNCHGSFATATCVTCGHTCPGSRIEQDILSQRIARCPLCPQLDTSVGAGGSAQQGVTGPPAGTDGHVDHGAGQARGEEAGSAESRGMPAESCEDARRAASHGVLKPDIVFFKEALPANFFASLRSDLETLDLLLVIGTSLRVAPVSEIVSKVDAKVPAILINREVCLACASAACAPAACRLLSCLHPPT